MFSQYKYLNPMIFGLSFYSFRKRYFEITGYGMYKPVLKKRIHSIAIRVTKAECLDLPDVTDIIQHVDLETAALRMADRSGQRV
ncbi:MAG: hypothetical protein LBS11_07190 [Oscillospiraceae bacterium]|jgi:hypothetical protein|nr:hypothetical protein [Oscillospiraceae bacterium]